jgi:hypothetical protein
MREGARVRTLLKALALVALGVMLATAVGALGKKKPLEPAKPQPSPPVSVRATGVGVPQIGEQGTVAISDLASALRSYHDGGGYASDLQSVDSQAASFMTRQAKALRQKRKQKCSGKGKKKSKKKARAAGCAPPHLAIVLDIDETSLSNYAQLESFNFSNASAALINAAVSTTQPAIGSTLGLYQLARAAGISVFAITGRPTGSTTCTGRCHCSRCSPRGCTRRPTAAAVSPGSPALPWWQERSRCGRT